MTTPFQNFNLDLDNIAHLLPLIAPDANTMPDIARNLGMGPRKVRDIFEWCNHLDLIAQGTKKTTHRLTSLGQRLAAHGNWTNRLPILDILYASLIKRHKVINRIVNELAYTASLHTSCQFSSQQYRDFLVSIAPNLDAKSSVILDRGSKFLNALAQPSGLGKLKMFSWTEDRSYVRIQRRIPAWQSAAYILYDSWPENTSRMRIKEVVSGQTGLGRIFFLTQPQVMALLSKLEQERAIALEVVADLSQIGPNPSMKAEDFLEMLIHDRS